MRKSEPPTFSKNSDFYEKVYAVVKEIPPGKVTSYGLIAEFLGAKSSARLVGYAMNGVGNRIEIPAHRVVNRIGLLTGKFHFETPETMKNRLLAEGVEFIDSDQVDMKKHGWSPSEMLPIAFRMSLIK
ncbi:MAG: MGMT family protein [Bacteroidetes bacterium]|nr:MGMT family protein [Bacteroidota bacterium]